MKNIKLLILFCLCIIHSGYSQMPAPAPVEYAGKPVSSGQNLVSQWSIVVNPTLLLTEQEEVFVEYQPYQRFAFVLGGGYNVDIYASQGYGSGGSGFTIRGGVMYATGPFSKNYIAFMAFFRQWSLVEASQSLGSPPQFSDFSDYIFSASAIFGSPFSDSKFIDIYHANVSVWCFDFEDVLDLVRTEHFIFQGYIGFGVRDKYATLTHTDYCSTQAPTYVPVTPSYQGSLTESTLDFKLGFLLGYRF